jgi:cell division protein FtsA
MNSDDPVGIIEISNETLKCLIFKIEDDNFYILSSSTTPSKGIVNGVIANISSSTAAIRSCISIAEKKAKISIKKIHVVLEQTDFLCTKFSKQKKIDGSKIDKDDIDFLLKDAKKQLIHNDNDQSIIHIFNHNYVVDGKKFIDEPIGIHANFFTHEITFITMPKNNLRNINQIFQDCDIEIERILSSTFVLGTKLLDKNDLNSGSILIDLGSEKVSIGIFKSLALIHSISFPVGTNHITRDLSKVCSLDFNESVIIKNNIDLILENNQILFDENNYLKKNYFINSNFRKISKKLIVDIIKSRLDEILGLIKNEIVNTELKLKPGIKIFLTGEGKNLINLNEYISSFFTMEVKSEMESKDQSKENIEKEFEASLGAINIIMNGWETEAIPNSINKSVGKMDFFSRLFGND